MLDGNIKMTQIMSLGGFQGNERQVGVVSATSYLFFKTALLRYIPKIQSFEVYSSVVFSIFTQLCNHHYYLI